MASLEITNKNEEEDERMLKKEGVLGRVYFNFAVFCSSVFLLNFDLGIFPLAVQLIMADIGINHAEVAFMGTSVNLGVSLGCLFVPILFRKFTAKANLLAFLLLHMFSMAVFSISSIYGMMVVTRFVCGIAAAGHLIFIPVFINNFGPKHIRATWISFINLANPIGMLFGVLFSILFILNLDQTFKWRLPIAIQLTLEALLFFFIYKMNNSEIDIHEISEESVEKDFGSFFTDFKKIVKSSMVTVGTVCYCLFFFSMAGIQFWSSLYMQKIYGIPKETSYFLYIAISVFACVIGIFGGGFFVDKMVFILFIRVDTTATIGKLVQLFS